jgi:uncharacterized protein (DUF433 family)
MPSPIPKQEKKEVIDSKIDVLGGEEVFKGTRIPVLRVIHLVQSENKHPKEVQLEYFPELKIEDIYFALWYVTAGRVRKTL